MSPAEAVIRCQQIMSHAWMVRTFVKHAPETEDFPELMGIVRTVFDLSRALETRVDNPSGYVEMLEKKLGKLHTAVQEFREQVPAISDHTNFQQAVLSIKVVAQDLKAILEQTDRPRKVPRAVTLPFQKPMPPEPLGSNPPATKTSSEPETSS